MNMPKVPNVAEYPLNDPVEFAKRVNSVDWIEFKIVVASEEDREKIEATISHIRSKLGEDDKDLLWVYQLLNGDAVEVDQNYDFD